MKIAIVANGPLTRAEAPFNDPEWECWGLGERTYQIGWQDRYKRIYEIHDEEEFSDHFTDEYKKWLIDNKAILRADVPWEDIRNLSQPDGFDSSMAVMIACAILEMPEEIGVWGIDARIMSEEEYAYQWPNIMWVLGIARGCGIGIRCPKRSGLFTQGNYGAKQKKD